MNSNKQSNGDYEVHTDSCEHGAKPDNQLHLGSFDSCAPAVSQAITLYQDQVTKLDGNINGCYYCCNPCHTS